MSVNSRQKDKDDFRLSLFIAGYYFLYTCNEFIVIVLGGNQMLQIFAKLLMIVLLASAFPSIWKRIGSMFVASETVLMIMYLVSYFAYGNVSLCMLVSVMFYSVFLYFPLGVCSYCIINKEILFNLLYICSLIIQFILVIVLLNVGSMEQETYSMSTGYALILAVLVISSHWLKTKKLYDFIFVAVDLITIILFGSRGPILCFAVFVFIHICVSKVMTQRRKVLYAAMLIMAVCILLFNYIFIITLVADLLEKLGYSSRTLRLLAEGLGTYDSGRGTIQAEVVRLIHEKPWFGWGAVGGRETGPIPKYPHNIYLELLLSFGIPIGVILSVIITFILVKGVFQKETFSQLLAIVFVSKTVSLLISDSLFQYSEFFICIAFCLQGRMFFLRGSEGGKFKYYRKGANACYKIKE